MDSQIDLQHLASLIKNIQFTMFSTVNEDGSIVSRPMLNQEIDEESFDGRLWFFTKKDTAKVHSIKNDSPVNLAYANPEQQQYISITGKASIIEDREKMKDLWRPALAKWIPEGLNDPDVTLISVYIHTAEVWDTPHDDVKRTIGLVKSTLTGKPYDQNSQSQHFDINRPH